MPELPDITLYVDALRARVLGQSLEQVRAVNPFLVRSVDPPLSDTEGRTVEEVGRMGKRVVVRLSGEVFLVFHLMIAGRFRWKGPQAKLPGKLALAAFDFPSGTLVITEAGSRRRASLHVVRGTDALALHDPGGLEVLETDCDTFRKTLRRENHTLRRALTDPRLFSGIGNAYSDEILHAARLSPVKLTSRLTDDEAARLYASTCQTLQHWIEALRTELGDRFPTNRDVTAFREGFAVHGRFGQACPSCNTTVQRIRYAENETNYCPRCQTNGRILADRSLSRLLKDDWPRTVDELERRPDT